MRAANFVSNARYSNGRRVYAETEDGDDDEFKNKIKEKYATLNIKTYRMKELMGQKMKASEAGSPYEILDEMRSSIEKQEAGEEQTYCTTRKYSTRSAPSSRRRA